MSEHNNEDFKEIRTEAGDTLRHILCDTSYDVIELDFQDMWYLCVQNERGTSWQWVGMKGENEECLERFLHSTVFQKLSVDTQGKVFYHLTKKRLAG